MAAGHGGQVILSEPTRLELDKSVLLRDLGEQRLNDMGAPIRIYQCRIVLISVPSENEDSKQGSTSCYGTSCELGERRLTACSSALIESANSTASSRDMREPHSRAAMKADSVSARRTGGS